MSDYISREELRKHLKACYNNVIFDTDMRIATFAIDCYVENMPTADVHPIKRGKWEENAGYGGWGDTIYQCSECNIEFTCETGIDIDWNYCPNCGARMDLKDGDTE